MQQQRQTLSVCIRFHDGAHLRSASTVRELRFPPPLTLWLILDFSAFKIPSLVSPHFLVSMIPHVIWLSPGTLVPRMFFLRWGWVFFKSRLKNDVRRLGRGLAGLFSQQISVLNFSWMKRTCDVLKVFSTIKSFQVDIKSLKDRKESIWSIIRLRYK